MVIVPAEARTTISCPAGGNARPSCPAGDPLCLPSPLIGLNLRRMPERAGRAAERLDNLERSHAIHRRMLDAAARRPRSRDALRDRLRGGEF